MWGGRSSCGLLTLCGTSGFDGSVLAFTSVQTATGASVTVEHASCPRTKSKATLLPRLRFKVMSRPANERLFDQVNTGSGNVLPGRFVGTRHLFPLWLRGVTRLLQWPPLNLVQFVAGKRLRQLSSGRAML